jgi:hypothetical protein
MPRIRDIDIRPNKTLIRFGHSELEIPGGRAALKDWVQEQVASITDEQMIALRLRELAKTDTNLTTVATLYGKQLSLSVQESQ